MFSSSDGAMQLKYLGLSDLVALQEQVVYALNLSYNQLVVMATDERGAEFHMDKYSIVKL